MMECMPWKGAIGPKGEPRLDRGIGGTVLVHRLVWEAQYGPVPDGYAVHHECQNRRCVNPHHLAVMPHGEHTSYHKKGVASVLCKSGHHLSGDNVYITPDNRRQCRECGRRRNRAASRKRHPKSQ